MVDEQDWIHDATKILEEIDRVAKVTYVFATRLLFYGALRRAQSTLPRWIFRREVIRRRLKQRFSRSSTSEDNHGRLSDGFRVRFSV